MENINKVYNYQTTQNKNIEKVCVQKKANNLKSAIMSLKSIPMNIPKDEGDKVIDKNGVKYEAF